MKEKCKLFWKSFCNGTFQMLSASVMNKAVAMLSNMVITRVLTQTEYGIWSYVLNIYAYLSIINGLGLLNGSLQFGTESYGDEKEFCYYRFCLKAGLIFDAAFIALFLIGVIFWDVSIAGAKVYLQAYVPILVLEYIVNTLMVILRCSGRIKEYARLLNINSVLLAAGTAFGAFFGVGGVIAGKYAAFVFSLLTIVLKMRTEVRSVFQAQKLCWSETAPVWKYSIALGAASAMNLMLHLLDVSMVAALLRDSVELAIYKVATIIPSALTFIPSSVVVVALPMIIEYRNDVVKLQKELKRYYLWLFMGNLALCAFLLIAAPIVIGTLSGYDYLPAVPTFRVLIVAYLISGTFRIFTINVLAALREVHFNLIISGFSIICDVVLNYMFVLQIGAIGAAYSTLAVEMIATAMAMAFLLYDIKKRKSLEG